MRFFRLPSVFRILYPGALFRLDKTDKTVYLTFDDGPARGVTEEVLSVLTNEETDATFFCIGKSVEKNPEIFSLIRGGGFTIANHGYEHIKGWRTRNNRYIDNVVKGSEVTGSNLFRPPFGSLGLAQFISLKKTSRIVFWDLMLYDFDSTFTQEEMLRVLRRKIRPGSIIVLHDNTKSKSPVFLHDMIGAIREMGYRIGDLAADLDD